MSGLVLTITEAGRAALVNAANTGTEAVLLASVGVSAASFTPSPAATSLPGEIKRISTIAGEAVADDTVHVTVRDESNAVYTVRSFGLYLSDGTLFAVYSQPEPIMEKSAQAMLLLALDVAFADIDAAQITFGDTSFLNPPATTERQGVVELATPEETATGSDATRAVHPRGLKAAVTSWLNDRFGEGAPSSFIKGLLTSASAAVLRASLEIKSAALKDEGAGKGLDADKLDGEEGTFYRNAANLNAGTVPAARLSGTYNISVSGNATTATKLTTARTLSLTGDVTGGTSFDGSANAEISVTLAAAQVLEKLRTVDGSGSGVDADTVDGLHGHQLMRADQTAETFGIYRVAAVNDFNDVPRGDPRALIPFHTNYQAANRPGLNFFGGIDMGGRADYRWQFGVAIPSHTVQFWGRQQSAGAWEDWVLFWHSGNDGSGSGLDADLLDGLQGSFYRNASNLNTGTLPFDRLPTKAVPTRAHQLADGDDLNTLTASDAGFYLHPTHGISISNLPINRLGALAVLRWTSNLAYQMYATSISGVDLYLRGQDAYSNWRGWEKVWHTGNDGSGSGMDADTVDGQHASAFAKVNQNNNFQGSTNALVSGSWVGDSFQLGAGYIFRVGSSGTKFHVGTRNTSNPSGQGIEFGASDGSLLFNSHLVWHAGIDGSGSGMDADLLDGLHAADFAKLADFIASKTTNGYCRLPNGMILQAGRFSAVNDSTVTVTFPIAFPNMCMGVVVSGTAHLKADAQDNNPAVRNGSVTLTSFQVFNAADTTQAFFLAFGY